MIEDISRICQSQMPHLCTKICVYILKMSLYSSLVPEVFGLLYIYTHGIDNDGVYTSVLQGLCVWFMNVVFHSR